MASTGIEHFIQFEKLLMQSERLVITTFWRVLEGGVITWAGQRARLLQADLRVSVDRQLQAAAQLLVHQAALFVAGAVRHEAGQVPVMHAVSTHHALRNATEEGARAMSYHSPKRELLCIISHYKTQIDWSMIFL